MKKRIISIALSLCTVLSLFPVSAHAEGLNTPEPLYSNAGVSVSGNNAQSIISQGSRVENVQALLNSLPTVTELEGAEEATINAAYEAAQNVYDAIEELEAEEIALLTDMEKLSTLMDWFNGRVMTLDVDADKVALTYKASGATNITTETFDTMYGALEKVRKLSNATEITITAGRNISNLSAPDVVDSYKMPSGTYTIILNNDFSFLSSEMWFRVFIERDTDVTIKSNTTKYNVYCYEMNIYGKLTIEGLDFKPYESDQGTYDLYTSIEGTLNLNNSTFLIKGDDKESYVRNNGILNLNNLSEFGSFNSQMYYLKVYAGTVNLSGTLSCDVELKNKDAKRV